MCSLWAQKGEVTSADVNRADHENAKMASLGGFSSRTDHLAPRLIPRASPLRTLEPSAPWLLAHGAIEVWGGISQDHEIFAL